MKPNNQTTIKSIHRAHLVSRPVETCKHACSKAWQTLLLINKPIFGFLFKPEPEVHETADVVGKIANSRNQREWHLEVTLVLAWVEAHTQYLHLTGPFPIMFCTSYGSLSYGVKAWPGTCILCYGVCTPDIIR